ncbi:hypothetical protein SKAU_G00190860 [Synaphobranchus kaupii]|uniref:Uncharacterized protein n=1 Tax=Synaphobranchus kaupii TaxID=118154 RepID=A0A9Q1FDM9_SYNKA|nr:hypothetical protein SKAU_G00190860 [Synaphobranchus kaupii]
MAGILARLLIFILIFQSADIPQFGKTRHVSVYQGEEQSSNEKTLSFDTDLANRVKQTGFGPGPGDPNRPSEINYEAFVEETSFGRGRRVLKSISSANGLIQNSPADKSTWPSLVAIKCFFRQTLERFSAYVREETSFARDSRSLKSLSSADGLIEIGPADESSSFATIRRFFCQTLERFSAYVREETSFARDSRSLKSLSSADGLIEIGPADESSSFAAIRRFFCQTLERFSAYVREETSFARDSRSLKSLSSADGLIEIGPADESSSFAAIRRFFCQTLERFSAYVRELVSKLVFGFGTRDPTRPSEIHFSDKVEALVEETSFARDSRSLKSLSSADGLIEIGPADESSSFAAIRRFFCQTLERFSAYVRELVGILPEEWNCTVLTIVASVEAAVIIFTFFIAQCFVKSTFLHIEEELDQIYKKLQKEQKQTYAMESKVMVLELELEIYERERDYQKLELTIVQDHLDTIDRKCQERKDSLKCNSAAPGSRAFKTHLTAMCQAPHQSNQLKL